jgi:hypothetical protein
MTTTTHCRFCFAQDDMLRTRFGGTFTTTAATTTATTTTKRFVGGICALCSCPLWLFYNNKLPHTRAGLLSRKRPAPGHSSVWLWVDPVPHQAWGWRHPQRMRLRSSAKTLSFESKALSRLAGSVPWARTVEMKRAPVFVCVFTMVVCGWWWCVGGETERRADGRRSSQYRESNETERNGREPIAVSCHCGHHCNPTAAIIKRKKNATHPGP